ncbi:MAG: hypothetical protein LBP61_04615 [Desulfovibrio sp.]|jgi:hypothetical protein|nr:hypothetical protein [Desulfovibrio sp.]
MDTLPEVLLVRPPSSAPVIVPIEPGHVYALDFPLETLQCEVQDHSLRFLFDSGAVLVLQGFLAAAEKENLFLRLEDGTLLQGKDIAQIFFLDLHKFVCDLDGLMGEESLSSVLDALPPGPDPSPPADPPSPCLSPAASSGAWSAPILPLSLEESAEQLLLPLLFRNG